MDCVFFLLSVKPSDQFLLFDPTPWSLAGLGLSSCRCYYETLCFIFISPPPSRCRLVATQTVSERYSKTLARSLNRPNETIPVHVKVHCNRRTTSNLALKLARPVLETHVVDANRKEYAVIVVRHGNVISFPRKPVGTLKNNRRRR